MLGQDLCGVHLALLMMICKLVMCSGIALGGGKWWLGSASPFRLHRQLWTKAHSSNG